jgi:uncharacterized protein YndB with AHSA1/START domain
MATNSREIRTTPDNVWAVLADGWLYPLWVVGTTRIRDVDGSWPDVGSKLHHSAGVWPFTVDDDSEVLECDPGRFLRLRARGWPLGEAEVAITVTPAGAHTRVEIKETAVSGPGTLIPQAVETPLIRWRNSETLRRLAYIAENRRHD